MSSRILSLPWYRDWNIILVQFWALSEAISYVKAFQTLKLIYVGSFKYLLFILSRTKLASCNKKSKLTRMLWTGSLYPGLCELRDFHYRVLIVRELFVLLLVNLGHFVHDEKHPGSCQTDHGLCRHRFNQPINHKNLLTPHC